MPQLGPQQCQTVPRSMLSPFLSTSPVPLGLPAGKRWWGTKEDAWGGWGGGRLEQILLINPGKKKLSLTSHRGNEIKKRYYSTQAGTWQKSPSLKCR